MAQTTRYSDAELAEFKAHIETKLARAEEYLNQISEQVKDLQENKDSEGDWMDDTSTTGDLEMLFIMEGRQRKHIVDLENALLRIRNKSYGICISTGELIDKRRLLAVPTTTKSLEAKMTDAAPPPKKMERPAVKKKDRPNQIITKIIKKPTAAPKPVEELDIDEDDLDDIYIDGLDADLEDDDLETPDDGNVEGVDEEFDFDNIADDSDED